MADLKTVETAAVAQANTFWGRAVGLVTRNPKTTIAVIAVLAVAFIVFH